MRGLARTAQVVVLSACVGFDPREARPQIDMRHLYLTLQDQHVIDELLDGDVDAIRNPFRALLYYEAISWLAEHGAASFNSWDARTRDRSPNRLPFVPYLGSLRLNAKAQVEHRALNHNRGFTTWNVSAMPSSPTGMRLVPREQELVSEHRLSDTYASDSTAHLTRRIKQEGSIDSFISDDESTWQVALSVEPRRRIVVEPQNESAEAELRRLRIAPRAYVHVYPHGGVTVTLGLSLVFADDRPVGDVIRVIRLLTGRRAEPAFAFKMRGVASSPAPAFVRRLLGMTIDAIAPSAYQPEFAHLDYALSLSAAPDELSDAELSGMLTLDDRYEILRDRWVEARASLYGK